MHTADKRFRAGWLAVQLTVWVWVAGLAPGAYSRPQAPSSTEIPVVKGGVGPCSADFVVTDPSGKGLYNAKIHIQLKYGFVGAHRLELEVGTNSDGKARLEGLPSRIKKTAEFKVTLGNQSSSVSYDPESNCHPHHEVTLGQKQLSSERPR